MRFAPSRILAVLFCLTLLPASVYAQASITGVVKDTSGAVLPGVTVEASSPALIEKVRTAVSDGNGQYRIVDLRAGSLCRHLHAHRVQHRQARGHRADRRVHRDGERRSQGRHGGGNHHRQRRNADRGRPEREAAGDGERRRHRHDSLVARLRRASSSLNPAVTMGAGAALDVQVMPGLAVFGGAGGRGTEGPCAARWTQYRRSAQRRRHVGLRAGSRIGAGSVVHHVRRARRSRGRRTGDEHRPEDRRQHASRGMSTSPA